MTPTVDLTKTKNNRIAIIDIELSYINAFPPNRLT